MTERNDDHSTGSENDAGDVAQGRPRGGQGSASPRPDPSAPAKIEPDAMTLRREDRQWMQAPNGGYTAGEEHGTLTKPEALGAAMASAASTRREATHEAGQDVPVEWNAGDVILDTYEVKAELARGSFGTVHKVRHRGWNVDMAVKSALAHVEEDEITREAEVWMELGLHPNIVSCYFVRNLGGIPRIFVEYVDGGTLHEWLYGEKRTDENGDEALRQNPRELTLAQRLGIAIEICRGMCHAHTFEWTDRNGVSHTGFVHRDLKPLNILMTSDGMPRVTDFGLAGLGVAPGGRADDTGSRSHAEPPQDPEDVNREDATLLGPRARQDAREGATQASMIGGVPGTPLYTPPEQWDRHAVTTKAADVYAFGVVLYELFCGRRPFELSDDLKHAIPGLKETAIRRMHCEDPPPHPISLVPELDPKLSALMLECLVKDPDKRLPGGFAGLNSRLKGIYKTLGGESYNDAHPEPEAAELLADSLNNRALSYIEIGQSRRGAGLLDNALRVDPRHLESTYNRGLILWRSGRLTDVGVLQQLKESTSSERLEWRKDYHVARIHIERDDCEEAVALLKRATPVASDEDIRTHSLAVARATLPRSRRCLRKITRGGSVNTVCMSSDAEWVLAGGRGGEIGVWDFASGKCLHTLSGHKAIISACFSADRQHILSAGYDGAIRWWRVATGQCVRVFEPGVDRGASVALSADDLLVLSGNADNSLKLWEVSTGHCIRSFGLHGSAKGVSSICLSSDGQIALSGRFDIKVWDTATGDCLRTLKDHTDHVSSLCLTSDKRFVLSGSWDSTLKLWNLRSGTCVRTFVGHTNQVMAISLSADGAYVMSASLDNTLRLWEVATGRCIRTFVGHTRMVNSVSLSANGQYAASGSLDGTLRLWRVKAGRKTEVAPFMMSSISTSAHGLTVQRAFAEDLGRAEDAFKHGDMRNAVQWCRRARQQPGNERHPEAIDLWNRLYLKQRCTSLRATWLTASLNRQDGGRSPAYLSADGRYAMWGRFDHKLRVLAVGGGIAPRTLDGVLGRVESATINSNGQYVLSGHSKGKAVLWYAATGQQLRTFEGQNALVNCGGGYLSADGKRGVFPSDRRIELWDMMAGVCLRTLKGHRGHVRSASLSTNARLALSRESEIIRVWDVRTGECLRTFERQSSEVCAACFGPDGRHVATGNWDGTVRVWDVADGKCRVTLEGHESGVLSVCFSSDGRLVLSGEFNGQLILWDATAKSRLHTFDGHGRSAQTVCLSADWRHALAAYDDGIVKAWALDWALSELEPVEWDEGARYCLEDFLTLRRPASSAMQGVKRRCEHESCGAFPNGSAPMWSDGEFEELLFTVGCAGYGWLRPEGVRRKLEEMAANWEGPPPLPGQPVSMPCHSERADRREARGKHHGVDLSERPTRRVTSPKMVKLEAIAVLAEARQLLEQGEPNAAKQVVTAKLSRLMLGGNSFFDMHAVCVGDAQLDVVRQIVWVTGDVGFAMATDFAYPYDLDGRHLPPQEVVDIPSDAWGGYGSEHSPTGLSLPVARDSRRPGYARLVAAPGDDTLVYEHTNGQGQVWARYVIHYNGKRLSGLDSESAEPGQPVEADAGGASSNAGADRPQPSEAATLVKDPQEHKNREGISRRSGGPMDQGNPDCERVQQGSCPHCGASILHGTRFCVNCGEPIVQRQEQSNAKKASSQRRTLCKCGTRNPLGNAFCGQCGRPLEKAATICGSCGEDIPPDVQFCIYCGKEVDKRETG